MFVSSWSTELDFVVNFLFVFKDLNFEMGSFNFDLVDQADKLSLQGAVRVHASFIRPTTLSETGTLEFRMF